MLWHDPSCCRPYILECRGEPPEPPLPSVYFKMSGDPPEPPLPPPLHPDTTLDVRWENDHSLHFTPTQRWMYGEDMTTPSSLHPDAILVVR